MSQDQVQLFRKILTGIYEVLKVRKFPKVQIFKRLQEIAKIPRSGLAVKKDAQYYQRDNLFGIIYGVAKVLKVSKFILVVYSYREIYMRSRRQQKFFYLCRKTHSGLYEDPMVLKVPRFLKSFFLKKYTHRYIENIQSDGRWTCCRNK